MPRAGDAIPSNTYAVWIAQRVPCRLLTAIPAKTRESQQAQHAEATLAASHHPHARDSLFRGLGTKAAIETEFVRKGRVILSYNCSIPEVTMPATVLEQRGTL